MNEQNPGFYPLETSVAEKKPILTPCSELFIWLAFICFCYLDYSLPWASLVAQMVKCLPAMQETWVRFLGWKDPLEKEMAIHSSTLAWKIPWTEEPDSLQSMGSQRVGHDWETSFSLSEDPAPPPDCKLKCLCSTHREIICPCPSVNKDINMPLPNAAHSLGDVLQDWRPFHFTSPLPLTLYFAIWL